jgi:F-type H+-transporting ATPase subunit a
MPETLALTLGLTRLLNHLFGGAVAATMQAVDVRPANPAAPINDTFALEALVAAGLIVFFILVRLTLSVENPNPAQQLAEMVHEFTGNQVGQVMGHGYERFQAFITCILLFVLFNNLLGLIPGIETPTKSPSVPLGLAVLTFVYYHFHGFRVNKIGYLKQFVGPVWWISWLLCPIEIISHLARVMSLTIRLYANMLASDLVTLVFFSLIPLAIPSVFLGLHFFVSLIQAYIFMLLSSIYLAGAISHEH